MLRITHIYHLQALSLFMADRLNNPRMKRQLRPLGRSKRRKRNERGLLLGLLPNGQGSQFRAFALQI